MTRHLLYIGIIVFLSSCSKDPAELYFEDQAYYFDLPAFMSDEILNLNSEEQWVRKKVTKDGHTQVIERGNINWEEELDGFTECDLNRPAWRGAFKIDTISLERVYVITYKAINKEIPVKNVVITVGKETKQCLQVTVDRSTKNCLYTSDQKLLFTTGEGYMVKGKLSVTFLFDSEYSIESEFIEI